MSDVLLIYLLVVLLTMLAFIPLVGAIWAKSRHKLVDIFEPIYGATMYFVLIFAIRSVYALRVGTIFMGDPPFDVETRQAWIMALVYLTIAICAFMVTYYSGLGAALARAVPPLPQDWAPARLWVVVPALALIGLIALGALVEYFGGLEAYLANKQRTLTEGGTTYLYTLVGCLWLGTVASYVGQLEYGWPAIFTWCLLALTVVIMATTGSKGLTVFPVLSLVIVRHYIKRPLGVGKLLALGFFGLPLVPLFNIYRHATSVDEIVPEWIGVMLTPEVFLTHVISRFHDMDAFVTIIRDTPKVMDFQLGATLLPLATAWIPRAVWADKPVVSFGKTFGETYWAQFFAGTGSAPSVTVLGEGYINFHIAGVVSVAALSGLILRAVYQYLVKGGTTSGILVYSVIYGPYLVMFWESDIVGLLTRALIWSALAMSVTILLGRPRSAGRGITRNRVGLPGTSGWIQPINVPDPARTE